MPVPFERATDNDRAPTLAWPNSGVTSSLSQSLRQSVTEIHICKARLAVVVQPTRDWWTLKVRESNSHTIVGTLLSCLLPTNWSWPLFVCLFGLQLKVNRMPDMFFGVTLKQTPTNRRAPAVFSDCLGPFNWYWGKCFLFYCYWLHLLKLTQKL